MHGFSFFLVKVLEIWSLLSVIDGLFNALPSTSEVLMKFAVQKISARVVYIDL